MNRLPCLVVFAAAAAFGQAGTGFGGQVFRKAPPHIDEALKARIDTFYNLHMEGKFRQADAIVHEDSKDIFFEAEKVRMRGFKLVTINYEDDFNRAKVVVDLDTEFYFVGFGKMDVHRPLTSTWKRDSGGSWWWYVEKTSSRETPFGLQSPGPHPDRRVPGEPSPDLSKLMDTHGIKVKDLLNKITVDKTSIELSSHEVSSGEFTIKNNFDGPVDLAMQADDFEGASFKLDPPRIEPGGEAKLVVTMRPKSPAKKPTLRVLITAEPLGKTISLLVNFAYPPFNEPAPGTRVGPPTAKPPAK
jgi:hypothetical protein